MLLFAFFTNIPVADGLCDLSMAQKLAHCYHSMNSNFDGTMNGALGAVFSTTANNDCYTYSNMLKQVNKGQFVRAMLTETAVHEAPGHWTMMLRKDMPSGTKKNFVYMVFQTQAKS